MMGEDAVGSSTQEPDLADATPWGIKERLMQEKTAVGFYLSGHLFDEVQQEVRRFVRTPIAELGDSRETQVLAGIISDSRQINGQRGKLALFKIDDKSAVIEASADEAVIAASGAMLKDDEFVVLSGRLQLDHFSGGLRLKVQQVWDLARRAHALAATCWWAPMAAPGPTWRPWCVNFPATRGNRPRRDAGARPARAHGRALPGGGWCRGRRVATGRGQPLLSQRRGSGRLGRAGR